MSVQPTMPTEALAEPANGSVPDVLEYIPEEPPPRRAGRRIMLALLVLGLGSAGWYYGPGTYRRLTQHQEKQIIPQARLHTVQRGDLRIAISEGGRVRTVNSTRVYPAYQGAAKITWLVREGADVKQGDKLATFDSAQSDEVLRARKGDLEAGIRAVTIAEEALTIQKKTSESAVAQARNAVDEANVNFRVFREMEAPKRLAELDTAINEAKTKLATAAKELGETQNKMDAQTTIEEEQRKVLDRELSDRRDALGAWNKRVKAAELERKAYRAYSYPQMLAVKKQSAASSQILLEKATVEAKSQVLQKEAELARSKDQVTRIKAEITRLEKQIAAFTLVAPVDGFVVYGDPGMPVYYGQRVSVGSDWYQGNVLLTIPDPSSFEITVGIPETVRGWLKDGCEATAVFDAVPGLALTGKVKKIEKVARPGQYYEQGSNVFDGVISLDKMDPRLVTGMSARIEIVADVLKGVLQAPIEAVVDEAGQTVCYVKGSKSMERREVKVGRSSLHAVEIVEGLSEGDQVDLAPDQESSQKTSQAATKPSAK